MAPHGAAFVVKNNLTPAGKNPGLAESLFPTRLNIFLKKPAGLASPRTVPALGQERAAYRGRTLSGPAPRRCGVWRESAGPAELGERQQDARSEGGSRAEAVTGGREAAGTARVINRSGILVNRRLFQGYLSSALERCA